MMWLAAHSWFADRALLVFIAGLLTVATVGIWDASFNDPPENIKVNAKFVGYISEGYNEWHGKTRSDVHYAYAVYELEDKTQVVIRAEPNVPYPTTAVLYANRVQ